MDVFETNIKIITEDIAKLYEHTDKIIKKDGKVLVDIEFNITEKEVDSILIERVRELLNTLQKEYTEEELISLVNKVKKDAVRKINEYRQEKDIKEFEENDIER